MRPAERLFDIIQLLRGRRAAAFRRRDRRAAGGFDPHHLPRHRRLAGERRGQSRVQRAWAMCWGRATTCRRSCSPPRSSRRSRSRSTSCAGPAISDCRQRRPLCAQRSPPFVRRRGAAWSRHRITSRPGVRRMPRPPCLSVVREAIRVGRKLRLEYRDREGGESRRVVWPLAIAYYAESTVIGAWCELRADYRPFPRRPPCATFRCWTMLMRGDGGALLSGWRSLQADYAASWPSF